MPRFQPRSIKSETLKEWLRHGDSVLAPSLGDASMKPGWATTASGLEPLLKSRNFSENEYRSG